MPTEIMANQCECCYCGRSFYAEDKDVEHIKVCPFCEEEFTIGEIVLDRE